MSEGTLKDWKASAEWQARLAERDAAAAAAAQAVELAPLERLRGYLDKAVDTLGQMADGKLKPCKTRLAAARDILDRFKVQERESEKSAWADAVLRLTDPGQVLERAKSWGNWRNGN